jgi:signal transduction histidine kinase
MAGLARADLAVSGGPSASTVSTGETTIRQFVHDIRSPIAAIEASASALQMMPNVDPDSRRMLDLIVVEARLVQEMASQALGDNTASRDAAVYPSSAPPAPALLSEVLHIVAGRCRAAWNHPVEIKIDENVSDWHASTPATELVRVLTNLVDNAFQHGRAASVTVEAERRGGRVMVRVRTDGLDLTDRAPRTSHGLGLGYVDQFAREHGVSVNVRGWGVDRVDELSFPAAG